MFKKKILCCYREKPVLCFLLLCAGLLFSTMIHAGEDPAVKDTPGSSKLFIDLLLRATYNADSSSATIPFSRAGNLVLLQAKADTTEGNFVLDTGCPSLVLNITYFRDYPVMAESEERNGITAATFVAEQTQVAEFALGGFRYYKMSADLANLGNIENTKGVKILGLLGVELFRQFEMIIDFDKNLIHLQLLNRKGTSTFRHPAFTDTSNYTIVPFEITDNRILLSTVLAGKKIKLILDSGAETNLLDSRLPEKIFDQVIFTGRTTLTGAGNKKVEVMKGNLRSLRIGKRDMESLPVLVTNLERTCFSYAGCVDGILGFDFLSLNRIGFNFVTKKLYIWK
jgi:Aspartyl protease